MQNQVHMQSNLGLDNSESPCSTRLHEKWKLWDYKNESASQVDLGKIPGCF